MPDGSSPPAYEEIHEPSYEEEAARTFAAEFVPSAKAPAEIVVSGPCPRCRQSMTYRHPLLIIRGVDAIDEAMAEGLWDLSRQRGNEMPDEWSFTAYCRCQVKHDKAPDQAVGCGAYWGMMVGRVSEETRNG